MADQRRRTLSVALLGAGLVPAARASDQVPPLLPRTWVVAVEGERRTRTLRLLQAQADERGGWTIDGQYAYTGEKPAPLRVQWRAVDGRHRVRFVTGAKSVVEVEGDDPDALAGSFAPMSGQLKAVRLSRVLTGSTEDPFVDPAEPALPERVGVPVFHPGDRWHWLQREPAGGPVTQDVDRIVFSVHGNTVSGAEGNASFAMTTDLMVMRTPGTWVRGEPRMFSFPMFVGKRWSFAYSFGSEDVDRGRQSYSVEVLGAETVVVPAGTFRAFKLRGIGGWFNLRLGAQGTGTFTVWYAPVVKNFVKWGYVDRGTNSMRELIEFQVRP